MLICLVDLLTGHLVIITITIIMYSLNMTSKKCSERLKECSRGRFQDHGGKSSCSVTGKLDNSCEEKVEFAASYHKPKQNLDRIKAVAGSKKIVVVQLVNCV